VRAIAAHRENMTPCTSSGSRRRHLVGGALDALVRGDGFGGRYRHQLCAVQHAVVGLQLGGVLAALLRAGKRQMS
jgi:hypothetical protein